MFIDRSFKGSHSGNDSSIRGSGFVIRNPISIFWRIKDAKDEEEKRKLKQLLETLRTKLPDGFKIGAAEEDCFFDSVAQGLKELKEKGLIIDDKDFSVKSLRENFKQYAQINLLKKHSWLGNTIKEENKKLCQYIPSIEFTAEGIENASSDSEMKFLQLQKAVWGRPEIEGKVVSKQYGVKIIIIELRDEKMGGLHVTTEKVGKGNNTIYIVNYRNHFVPLLSNIRKDIKRRLKVSRNEVYCNLVDSGSNNISQSHIFTPLININHKQGGYPSGKENGKTSRKRMHSFTEKNDIVSKRPHMAVTIASIEDSEFLRGLQNDSVPDSSYHLNNTRNTMKYIPHRLMGLMYQLDLSLLCSLRKLIHEQKYPLFSLVFGDSEYGDYNDIVLCYKNGSIYIKIEVVDQHNIKGSSIGYAKLFTKEKRHSVINDYFDSFVKHLMCKTFYLSNHIKYFIIYTTSGLDLTEEKELKQQRFKKFYPFKFDCMIIEECDILRDFLFTNNDVQGRSFYQFSQDIATRKELLKRLEFSSAMQKIMNENNFSLQEIKEAFLNKLVFAVNQPNREELNTIIKNEIGKVHIDYMTLQETILCELAAPEKHGIYVSGIIYEFNLLLSFLHYMFLHKNISSINSKNRDIFNDIAINCKGRITYIKAHTADCDVDYSQLFPSKKIEKNSKFSVNKHLSVFIEELKNNKDIRYFIIYTNVRLDLTKDRMLKKGKSKDYSPFKFDRIDIQKKKYKILRDCLFIKQNGFYQFAEEGITKLLTLLKLPPSWQKTNLLSENEVKEKFLGKLIFAVSQYNCKELNSVIKNEIDKSNVPYNYEELHEIALRWSESDKVGSITKEIMGKLLEDIKNNRSSYQEILTNFDKEIKFARTVVGREGTYAFHQFLDFLTKGKGKGYLGILKSQGINLASMSSILDRARNNATKAFDELYNLWFDSKGNKTKYLKISEGVNLTNMSSILSGAGSNAAKAFKELYDLWFDGEEHKTQYLKTLEENGINLSNVSSILSRAGFKATKAFKDLYDFWFDEEGHKTQYLKTLEECGINLTNLSSILSRAGPNAAKAFRDLYNLWFDAEGNKTKYLKTLEESGINLSNLSSILSGAGSNAAKAFIELYHIWFDAQGNKTHYLRNLEEKEVILTNISGILSKAGINAAKSFKCLYDLWFDYQGNKTKYLKALERTGVSLTNISSILSGAGVKAAKAFKGLYDLWFDEKENKTQYLKTLEENGIYLINVSSILSGAGSNTATAFRSLYYLWFDKNGNKTQRLKALEKNAVSLPDISGILSTAGVKAEKAFKDLYDLWFDEQGNRTKYLKCLEENEINLINMSSILKGTGVNAATSFKSLYDLWFVEQGSNKTKYLKTLEENGMNLPIMSSILNGAGDKAGKAFIDLYYIWFDEEGNKNQILKTLEENGIHLSCVSSILHGVGVNAAKAFKSLYDLWFDKEGNKSQYLKTLQENRIKVSRLSSILGGAGVKAAKAFKELYDLWFDVQGNKKQYLKTLEESNINISCIFSILHGAGTSAAKVFNDLHDLWFDEGGNKTQYLKTLEENRMNLSNMSNILYGAGVNAAIAFKGLYDLWFDGQGSKTRYLKTLEENEINLSCVSSILHGAGVNAPKSFKLLHDLWFDEQGNTTQILKTLEENGIYLPSMSSILSGAGVKAAKAFKELYDIWFDEQGNKKQHLKTLKENGINISCVSNIVNGAGFSALKAFKCLYDLWFDKQENKTIMLKTLEENGIYLPNMSNILNGAGVKAAKAFKELYDLWFDVEGNKTQYLKTLEENGINLSCVSSILNGVGVSAAKAYKDLYDLWFDKASNKTQYLKTLEENVINLSSVTSILHGAGTSAPRAFKGLYDLWFDVQGNKKEHLKHFVKNENKEKNFVVGNLSGILAGAGVNASNAFQKLHDVCFMENGEETELLNNFYEAGFKPGNLSCMLFGSGSRASRRLKKFHAILFDDEGNEMKLLIDFRNIGFNPHALCNILSGSLNSLEQFHEFCYSGKGKMHLSHFSREGFTINNLSSILHGARDRICSAFKHFHNVCFDGQGNNTQLLNDFHELSFKANHLSTILCMAGNNSASILKDLHKSCFNEGNYLSHFLAEKKLFNPQNISYILGRIGISVHSAFKKFHDLCFDEAGNRKSFLDNLIKNKQKKVSGIPDELYKNEIIAILYKKVRKSHFTVSDKENVNKIVKTDLELNNNFLETAQKILNENIIKKTEEWFDEECSKAIHEKNKDRRRMQKARTKEKREKYREIYLESMRKASKLCRAKKRSLMKNKEEAVEEVKGKRGKKILPGSQVDNKWISIED